MPKRLILISMTIVRVLPLNSLLLEKRRLTIYHAHIRAETIILTNVIGMCVVCARSNWVSEMHPRGRWPSLYIRGLPLI